jgi:hypothetical protein
VKEIAVTRLQYRILYAGAIALALSALFVPRTYQHGPERDDFSRDWTFVLNANRETKTVVEYGTNSKSTSRYLATPDVPMQVATAIFIIAATAGGIAAAGLKSVGTMRRET